MISNKSARERVEFAKKHGLEETLKHFQITLESLKRYARRAREDEPDQEPIMPKILLLDVETSLLLLYAFEIFKPRPRHTDIFQDWHMLSWAAKWLLDDQIYSDVLTPEEAKAHNDARICKSLWEYINDADVIIGHNARGFDVRKYNARFMLNGLKPPSPYTVIDTLVESRKMAMHTSHRLDHISKLFGGSGKLKNPEGLWRDCFWGKPEALIQMDKYNKEDVYALEDAYLFMRPWIKNHPNIGVWMFANEPRCATCGSKSLYEEGVTTTNVGMYRTFRCNDCKSISKERRTMIPAKNKKILLTSSNK
jgi:hypothetical protein